jgi:hypothetical protein
MEDKRTTHLAGMGAARDATTKTRTATREVVRMMMMDCVDSTLSSAMVAAYMWRWALTRTMRKSKSEEPGKRAGGEGQNGKAQDVHPLLISTLLFLQMYRTLSCMSS